MTPVGPKECDRFLADLSKEVVDSIKNDNGKIIIRCPKCSEEERWITLYSEDGKIVQESGDANVDFGNKLIPDIVRKFDQIA